jgi:hypothetical protein
MSEQVTINLLDANVSALERAALWTGHSQNDAANRAIALYEGILGGLLLEDEVLSYVDEHNQPVELILPAGHRNYVARLDEERRLRKLSNGLALALIVAVAVLSVALWQVAG